MANRRRSHIHFIKQEVTKTGEYTGTRAVIFIKGGDKLIYDTEGFKIHTYENSKLKPQGATKWTEKTCDIAGVIVKQMKNQSIDGRFTMLHIIYESPEGIPLENFIEQAFTNENVEIPPNLKTEFFGKLK